MKEQKLILKEIMKKKGKINKKNKGRTEEKG